MSSLVERWNYLRSVPTIRLSMRQLFRQGDPDWEGWLNFIGLPQLVEAHSIYSWVNKYAGDEGANFILESPDEIEETLGELPLPQAGKEYYLVYTSLENGFEPALREKYDFLGYDLSDETYTSSLLNCGRWEGELAPIAIRVNKYGLLTLADVTLAKELLAGAWNNDHHAFVTIWAFSPAVLALTIHLATTP